MRSCSEAGCMYINTKNSSLLSERNRKIDVRDMGMTKFDFCFYFSGKAPES